jgi:hypothetical protein
LRHHHLRRPLAGQLLFVGLALPATRQGGRHLLPLREGDGGARLADDDALDALAGVAVGEGRKQRQHDDSGDHATHHRSCIIHTD